MAAKTTFKDNLKKYLYSGVGLASHTGEVVRHSIDELMKKGKLNEADGKRIVDSAVKKMESKMPEFEARYREAVDKAMKFAHEEIAVLQKKIATYERRNGAQKKAAPAAKKAGGKKAAAKKSVRKVARKKVAKTAE
jgi:polyhydroxyalkanoate synthesis regulator phasin